MRGCSVVFFFQAEDGIRDAQESRGLGDVYKRQARASSEIAEATLKIKSSSNVAAKPIA
mgnify:CR=1 FL=1